LKNWFTRPVPKRAALVSGRSRTVELLLSEMTNPFFPELMQTLEDIAGSHDFDVMVGSTNHTQSARIFTRRILFARLVAPCRT
jgi:LacI family transcriptional regulator